MKFSYKIFPEQRVIVMRYMGVFTLSELIESAQNLWNDPRYSRSFDGIVDISHSSVSAAIGDCRALIEFVSKNEKTSEGRWAAVAGSPVATACAFLYRHAARNRHVFEVYSSWEAAKEFLHRELPDSSEEVFV